MAETQSFHVIPWSDGYAAAGKAFLQNVEKKQWWGLFVNDVLTSICALFLVNKRRPDIKCHNL